MKVERKAFYKPEEIRQAVGKKIKEANKRKKPIDYLTFVPDGEPNLDINLGKEIELFKISGITIIEYLIIPTIILASITF